MCICHANRATLAIWLHSKFQYVKIAQRNLHMQWYFPRANRTVSKTLKTQCAAGVSRVPCTFKLAPLSPRRKIMPLASQCLSRRKLLLYGLSYASVGARLPNKWKCSPPRRLPLLSLALHGDFIYTCGGAATAVVVHLFIVMHRRILSDCIHIHSTNVCDAASVVRPIHSGSREPGSRPNAAAGSPFRRTPKCIHSGWHGDDESVFIYSSRFDFFVWWTWKCPARLDLSKRHPLNRARGHMKLFHNQKARCYLLLVGSLLREMILLHYSETFYALSAGL